MFAMEYFAWGLFVMKWRHMSELATGYHSLLCLNSRSIYHA